MHVFPADPVSDRILYEQRLCNLDQLPEDCKNI
jgi:hypothetical protein